MQHLVEHQQQIMRECLQLKSGGLSIPMGSGKTLIGLILGCIQRDIIQNKTGHKRPIIIVCSKSLIGNWIHEINKFFKSNKKTPNAKNKKSKDDDEDDETPRKKKKNIAESDEEDDEPKKKKHAKNKKSKESNDEPKKKTHAKKKKNIAESDEEDEDEEDEPKKKKLTKDGSKKKNKKNIAESEDEEPKKKKKKSIKREKPRAEPWDNCPHAYTKRIRYEVVHRDVLKKNFDSWQINPRTDIVITTPDVLSGIYKKNNLRSKFIRAVTFNDRVPPFTTNYFDSPTEPLLNHPKGPGYIYSITWSSLIIDECQEYTNIETYICQSICSIHANNRWAFSGTLFNEPKVPRILGYFLLVNQPNTPRSIPDCERFVRSAEFKGLRPTTVYRENNPMFIPPPVEEHIISHRLTQEESTLYISIKQTMRTINQQVKIFRQTGDHGNMRMFSSYLLAIVTYLRQSLVCPLIPIASVAIDFADFENSSELSKLLMDQIHGLNLDAWLNNPDSIKSSRIDETLKIINKHQNQRIIVFSCYKACIDILSLYLPEDRQVYKIKSNMTSEARQEVVDLFSEGDDSILLLTYKLGSKGLNLQKGSIVLLLDFWWNASETKQAIARVLRYGQDAEKIHIYYFTSNTGLERAIFEKQQSKLLALDELQMGPMHTHIPTMTTEQIMRILETETNEQLLHNIITH